MLVQTVPFIPFFILGAALLLGPGLVVTLFTGSEPAGVVVVVATALAALIKPQIHWSLPIVLCAMRTIPFVMAAVVALAMRTGIAPGAWAPLIMFLSFGCVAHWRLHVLRRSGEFDI